MFPFDMYSFRVRLGVFVFGRVVAGSLLRVDVLSWSASVATDGKM